MEVTGVSNCLGLWARGVVTFVNVDMVLEDNGNCVLIK